MSTFSPAIGYATEITQVSTGNVPFGGSVSDVVMYTNNTDSKLLAYFTPMTARLTVAGGAGQQLTPNFEIQVYNSVTATWYQVTNSLLSTTFQSYASVGITHEIEPDYVSANNIYTAIKIQIPYGHRVVGNFSNPGSNSGTWDIFGLVEKYKST